MLVLSAHPACSDDEIILLVNGIEIVVSVVESNRIRCRIGIVAPKEVKILRRKVLEAKNNERQSS